VIEITFICIFASIEVSSFHFSIFCKVIIEIPIENWIIEFDLRKSSNLNQHAPLIISLSVLFFLIRLFLSSCSSSNFIYIVGIFYSIGRYKLPLFVVYFTFKSIPQHLYLLKWISAQRYSYIYFSDFFAGLFRFDYFYVFFHLYIFFCKKHIWKSNLTKFWPGTGNLLHRR